MILKVGCRDCFQHFVVEGVWTKIPEHSTSGISDQLCPGSDRFGYPMYVGRQALGRIWWGW